MIFETKMILIIIAICVLFIQYKYKEKLKKTTHIKILIIAFNIFLFGCIATIIGSFITPQIVDLIERGYYAIGSFFLALWCWKLTIKSNPKTN